MANNGFDTGAKLGCLLVGLITAAGLGCFSWAVVGEVKSGHWPLFVAPLIVVVNATSVIVYFWQRYRASNLIFYASLGALLAVLILAFFLTAFTTWKEHMWLMITLFGVFTLWDWCILWSKKLQPEIAKEIWTANLNINIPTMIALILTTFYITLVVDENPALSAEKVREVLADTVEITEKHRVTENQLKATIESYASPAERLVQGIIAFHLVFAAAAYMLVFWEPVPRIRAGWRMLSECCPKLRKKKGTDS